ncbi:DUF6223 family protein [Nonomuraea longicatena]|uniref:Integral membrane protein n=1 Tax=Nonomuraea longicatena TaxID=83682 RepID=A0ABN1PUC8_9ACTN
MSVRHLIAAAVLLGVFAWTAPAAAQVLTAPVEADVYTMSPGRIAAIVAALTGLAGTVAGALALARATGRIGTGDGRRAAVSAVAAGLVGVIVGGLVVATADGGLGTGNGLGGGLVAMLVGLAGALLGGLTLARSRRPV